MAEITNIEEYRKKGMDRLEREIANKEGENKLVELNLKGFKFLVDDKVPFAVFECETLHDVQAIFDALPIEDKYFTQGYGGASFLISSPSVHLKSEFSDGIVWKFSYVNNKIRINIQYQNSDVDELREFYDIDLRKATSYENVHMADWNQRQKSDYRIASGSFKGNQLKYYGGEKLLNDSSLLTGILDKIKGSEE